jgi:O-antigen ligase
MKERIHNSMGIQDRFRLWEANLDYFKHRPLTGIGWLKTQEMSEFYFKTQDPEHYRDYFWGHAHNNFFEMLGGTGILGTLAFLFWSFFTFRFALSTRKLAQETRDFYLADISSGLFVALILLHFNGLTNVTFWEGKVMHQQMFAMGLLFMIQITLRKTTKKIG